MAPAREPVHFAVAKVRGGSSRAITPTPVCERRRATPEPRQREWLHKTNNRPTRMRRTSAGCRHRRMPIAADCGSRRPFARDGRLVTPEALNRRSLATRAPRVHHPPRRREPSCRGSIMFHVKHRQAQLEVLPIPADWSARITAPPPRPGSVEEVRRHATHGTSTLNAPLGSSEMPVVSFGSCFT